MGMPGMGDYEAFPVTSPNDPRCADEGSDEITNAQMLDDLAGWIDCAKLADKQKDQRTFALCLENIARQAEEYAICFREVAK